MENLGSWTKFIDKPEQKIYFRKEENLSPLTCYIEGIIDAPMLDIVTIMAEVESYKDWLPITPVSIVLKEVTPFRKLIYLQNAL